MFFGECVRNGAQGSLTLYIYDFYGKIMVLPTPLGNINNHSSKCAWLLPVCLYILLSKYHAKHMVFL